MSYLSRKNINKYVIVTKDVSGNDATIGFVVLILVIASLCINYFP